MGAYKPQFYQSPIKIPEARRGKVEVRHRKAEKGERLPIIGSRQALLRGGMRTIVGIVQEPIVIHELCHDDHGTWMTDMPEELNQIGELLHTVQPYGRVLLGGLGLGILAKTLVNRGVDSVTVVEIDPDVIALCSDKGYTVVHADIEMYLRTTDKEFDFYLLDTWQATNEGTWWRTVMPLRRIIRQRWGKKPVIHAWAEDIMFGQIFRSLTTKEPHWFYSGLPVPMKPGTARHFFRDVGLPKWEKLYGETVTANLRG